MSEPIIRSIFVSLSHSIAYLHSILDPTKNWKRFFIPDGTAYDPDPGGVVSIPAEVVPLFLELFTLTEVPVHYGSCKEEMTTFQMEYLHLVGALLSGSEVSALSSYLCLSSRPFTMSSPPSSPPSSSSPSSHCLPPLQENAAKVALPQVCLLLLTLIDPREHCMPLQALAIAVVTRITHVLHCSVPEDVSQRRRGRDESEQWEGMGTEDKMMI